MGSLFKNHILREFEELELIVINSHEEERGMGLLVVGMHLGSRSLCLKMIKHRILKAFETHYSKVTLVHFKCSKGRNSWCHYLNSFLCVPPINLSFLCGISFPERIICALAYKNQIWFERAQDMYYRKEGRGSEEIEEYTLYVTLFLMLVGSSGLIVGITHGTIVFLVLLFLYYFIYGVVSLVP